MNSEPATMILSSPRFADTMHQSSNTYALGAQKQHQFLNYKAISPNDHTADIIRPRTKLAPNYQPSDNDVICGKGKNVFTHEGNRRFRSLVELGLERYQKAPTRTQKTAVVREICEEVRHNCSNGGGFIRQDNNGQWWEIGCQRAKEKVGHTIREALMNPDKQADRRKLRAFNKALRKVMKQKGLSPSPSNVKSIASQNAADAPGSMMVDPLQQVAMRITATQEATPIPSEEPAIPLRALSQCSRVVSDCDDPATTTTTILDAFTTSTKAETARVMDELFDMYPAPPPPRLLSQSSQDWFTPIEVDFLGGMPANGVDFEEYDESVGDKMLARVPSTPAA